MLINAIMVNNNQLRPVTPPGALLPQARNLKNLRKKKVPQGCIA
jgi:hypothetical protein